MKFTITYFHFSKVKKGKTWSAKEEERLKRLVCKYDYQINFSYLSLCFLGRTGKQIQVNYRRHVENG